ncbi:MAG: 5'/3'-nucleotidase SurE [Spirochaetaceae bacterium]|jgi:5'-nucleotidase|nr:5'/3'-nucleotidase SurE [Spirochaetaceae bacterium]
MNILLTNDDGIDGEGLTVFAESLRGRTYHTVYVIAPDTNRSGVSQAISFLSNPLRLDKHGPDTWACSGTPADCVMLGVMGALPVKPDIVVSGINAGANIGTDILYSGTAGAARQAGLYRIPGIALSLAGKAPFCWQETANFAADHLEEFAGMWREDLFINVNMPNIPHFKGMISTFPCIRRYKDSLEIFTSQDGRVCCFVNFGDLTGKPEEGSDGDAIAQGLVSVSQIYIHPIVRQETGNAPNYPGIALKP